MAITAIDDGSFTVRFPAIAQHDAVLKIHFVSRVLAFSTRFTGRALLVEEDAFQGITPGNAATLEEEDLPTQSGITVLSRAVTKGSLIGNFALATEVVTPNGDGVNDEAMIDFVLAKVEGAGPEVAIFDLSGQQVLVLTAEAGGFKWDGRGEYGQLLPAGVYICQIKLAVDVGVERAQRIINLAY